MVTSFPLSKPVASAASPPPAGGPANPFLFLLRLFRLFRLGEPAAVVFRHCRVQTLRQNHFHGVTGFAHHLCCRLQFRFLHRPQRWWAKPDAVEMILTQGLHAAMTK